MVDLSVMSAHCQTQHPVEVIVELWMPVLQWVRVPPAQMACHLQWWPR